MEIQVVRVGSREFLDIEGVASIPIDRIKAFDFKVPNGGASDNSVRIVTDDPNENYIFAYGNCDAIRDFLTGKVDCQ